MPLINVPHIDGSFSQRIAVRFDGFGYVNGQTVLNFGDTSGQENIAKGQLGASSPVDL